MGAGVVDRSPAPRFFVPHGAVQPAVGGFIAPVEGEEAHHAVRVLRLRAGDSVVVLDGSGYEYEGVVQDAGSRDGQACLSVLCAGRRFSPGEPSFPLTLVQALPKGDKMDLVIQKGTEVGVTAFCPVVSDRVVVRYSSSKAERRCERWRRVALEAAKQASRGRLPSVAPIQDLYAAVDVAVSDGASLLVLWERATLSMKMVLQAIRDDGRTDRNICVVVGPEGGFTDEEASALADRGGEIVSLGPRILRTETAGLVAAALVLYALDG